MNKIKTIIIASAVALFLGACGLCAIQTKKLNRTRAELEYALNNYKALDEENGVLKNTKRNLTLTVDQLNNSKDSIVVELNALKKELKIKDSEIKDLKYVASKASKTDTLYIKEEIFNNNVKLDTTITDGKWYKCDLLLEYPNKVAVSPTFESQKYLITHVKKEIQNPKKCKLLRIFQKKSTVVETEVVEKNPYIKTNQTKFLEIIK